MAKWVIPEAMRHCQFVTVGVYRGTDKNAKGYPFLLIEHQRPNGTVWTQKPQFDLESRSTGEETKIVQQLQDIAVGSPVCVAFEDVNAMVSGRGAWWKACAIVELEVIDEDYASLVSVNGHGEGF